MSVRNLFLICAALFFTALPLHAQSEARIKVISPGIDRLKEDLKFLVELSPTPALQKQWKTLDELIDSFAVGLNATDPIRVDLVFGKQSLGYEMHFPVEKLAGKDGFLLNLGDLGYSNKSLATGLYELSEGKGKKAKVVGFLRDANKYASIATAKEAVPAGLAHPITKDLTAYLEKGYDVALEMKNDPADKAGTAARLANFKELRKQLEAGITFKRDEDKNEFELRKLAAVQQFNEAERFLVESESLTVNWTTDIKEKKGHGDLRFSAMAGTKLQTSAELLASKPSYFANVKTPEKAAASIRMTLPLDELRTGHVKEFYKFFRPVMAKNLDERKTLTDPNRKTAAKKVADLIIDMVEAAIPNAVVDGILNLTEADGGKHTLVFGIRAADGKKADQVVELFSKVWPDLKVSLKTAEIGGASLHTLTLPDKRLERFQKFFPEEKQILVATSKDAVWIAVGTNAQAELTTAITAVEQPAPEKADPVVATFSANMAKLVAMVEAIRPEQPESTGPKTAAQKDAEKVRGLAEQAVKGCEPRLSMELKRNGNIIEATIDVTECALKVVGTLIADYSKVFN